MNHAVSGAVDKSNLQYGRYAQIFSTVGDRSVIEIYHSSSGQTVYISEYFGDCSVAEFDMFFLVLALNCEFGFASFECVLDDPRRLDAFLEFRQHYGGEFRVRRSNNMALDFEVYSGHSGHQMLLVSQQSEGDRAADRAKFFADAINRLLAQLQARC